MASNITKTPEMDRLQRMGGIAQAVATAIRLKEVMLRRHLNQAQAECPRCGGTLYGTLAGPKNHIYMHCMTRGCIELME